MLFLLTVSGSPVVMRDPSGELKGKEKTGHFWRNQLLHDSPAKICPGCQCLAPSQLASPVPVVPEGSGVHSCARTAVPFPWSDTAASAPGFPLAHIKL